MCIDERALVQPHLYSRSSASFFHQIQNALTQNQVSMDPKTPRTTNKNTFMFRPIPKDSRLAVGMSGSNPASPGPDVPSLELTLVDVSVVLGPGRSVGVCILLFGSDAFEVKGEVRWVLGKVRYAVVVGARIGRPGIDRVWATSETLGMDLLKSSDIL